MDIWIIFKLGMLTEGLENYGGGSYNAVTLLITNDHMAETMREVPPDANKEKEAISTSDPYEAITKAAEGEKVVFAYSEHYGSYVTFEPNGKVTIDAQEVPVYEHNMGDAGSSMDSYVTDMRRAIETVKKAKLAVPVGNVERFGGMKKIAQDIMDTSQVEAYIKSYEKMTPAEQDEYRKTMTDKRE